MEKPSKRILCVDDDKDTCEMLAAILRLQRYEVVQARTIASALLLASAENFDLIILDWKLPDGTGVELCQKLAGLLVEAPVLFYSGNNSDETWTEAMNAGASGFLVKPVPVPKLLQTISDLAGERSAGLPSQERPQSQT